MPNLWDYIHVGRSTASPSNHEFPNLQEGLFQIASQTCNILVTVNNTNNISYGSNTTNIQYNNFTSACPTGNNRGASTSSSSSTTYGRNKTSRNSLTPSTSSDFEQSVVLLSHPNDVTKLKGSVGGSGGSAGGSGGNQSSGKKTLSRYRHRLSTVLESGTPAGDDDFELWDQSQMLREQHGPVNYKWGHSGWCKPSCIPISVILILIILVVLLPLLDHANEKHSSHAKFNASLPVCSDVCNIQLVESIPEGLVYPKGSPAFLSTFDAWQNLITLAENSIDIASFYWTMRREDVVNHTSAWQGEKIFQLLLNVGKKNKVKVRIAQNAPTRENPNFDTELLIKRKAAEVRSVNFPRLLGGGVLHTKLWVIDERHIYLGSANMDWRSLTQVKEMGVLAMNCSCLAKDIGKIFKIYWELGKNKSEIPANWPEEYTTKYNAVTPLRIKFSDNFEFYTYLSSSPPPMSAKGRTQDLDAILDTITHAEKFVYISVMDYIPVTLYTHKTQFWPHIDNALKKAAVENKVSIKLLISWWNHSIPAEDYFLRSLESVSNSFPGVDIQVKRFIVPTNEDQQKIPFGRVNHNKYMVTDRTAYIGTSNWSGDYFINTAGIGLVMTDTRRHEDEVQQYRNNETTTNSIRDDLESVFLRDWNSQYAVDLK